jgi:hypothetical protein
MLGKHTLNPDEKTNLKVVFETEGRPGPFEKKVIFSTNIPGLETAEVFLIKGMVREAPAAKIRVEPRKIVLQGIEVSEGKKQILLVTNEGSRALTIGLILWDGARSTSMGKQETSSLNPARRGVELTLREKERAGVHPDRVQRQEYRKTGYFFWCTGAVGISCARLPYPCPLAPAIKGRKCGGMAWQALTQIDVSWVPVEGNSKI